MTKQASDPFAPPPKPRLIISKSMVYLDEDGNFMFSDPATAEEIEARPKINYDARSPLVEFEYEIFGPGDGDWKTGDDEHLHVETWYKVTKATAKRGAKKSPSRKAATNRKTRTN